MSALPHFSASMLQALLDEATVDAYGESEQATGIFTLMEEHLAVPFKAMILGMPVVIQRLDMDDNDQIVAVCRRGKHRQTLPILDVPLPSPPPIGAEWIAAYRCWRRGWQ